jgi:uncharacterized protein YggE
MQCSKAMLLAALLAVAPAMAQAGDPAPEPAVAYAVGKATVSQPATALVLGITRVFEGDTFEMLWPAARMFRSDLIAALSEHAEQATLRLTTDVELLDPPTIVARGGIVVNFGPMLSQPEGELTLATLMDNLRVICAELQITPGEIRYEGPDHTRLQQDAIRLATENAFPSADAVARALRADIFTVDQVRVLQTEFFSGPVLNQSGTSEALNGRQVNCTATVEVTYVLADRP